MAEERKIITQQLLQQLDQIVSASQQVRHNCYGSERCVDTLSRTQTSEEIPWL